MLPGDEFYLNAFWELSTCRAVGLSMGPIPWTAIVEYGERFGLDRDMMKVFQVVMRELDECFIEWHDEQRPKK